MVKPKREIGGTSRRRIHRTRSNKRIKPLIVEPVHSFDAENAPEPKDRFNKGLWECSSIEKVDQEHDQWCVKFTTKALRGVKRRKISLKSEIFLNALLTQIGATSHPLLINQAICHAASTMLRERLSLLVQANPDMEVGLITFIDGSGATSHSKTDIELFNSKKKVQTTLRAMSPNFFGVSELALFNSSGHPDGGQIVQRHEHALIFGENVVQNAQVIAAKHAQRFMPNHTGARTIDVKRGSADPVNLARLAAYLFKPPYQCKNWCPGNGEKKGHMNQSEKGDRYIRYLRLAQLRSMLSIEQVTFGGGEGQTIRSDMIKFLRALAVRDASGNKRVLHPDAVASFWVDLAKELKADSWNLPIIRTCK